MLVTTDLERGGLPLRILRIAPRLREAGVEPIIGCLARPGPISAQLRSAGFKTFSCHAGGRFDLGCLARLATVVAMVNPDLIHGALTHANLAVRLVGRLDRPRPVLTTTVTIEIERRWHLWAESLTAGLSDLHIANSNAVARHLMLDLGFASDRIFVLPNGIDVELVESTPAIDRRRVGIDDETALILWAGRMDPIKGLDTFVEVVRRLRRQRKVVGVLLGDGPARRSVERLVEECQLQDSIQMLGWRDDVVAWMKAADVLLLPSRTEGSPNVALEAIVAGCPVVASDLPGCRELLSDPALGSLCDPDDVSAFARRVAEALDGGDIPERSAALGRTKELHDLGRIAGRWAGLYRRALEQFR